MRLIRDCKTGIGKGFGFITFKVKLRRYRKYFVYYEINILYIMR
jgi:hypothetical protein